MQRNLLSNNIRNLRINIGATQQQIASSINVKTPAYEAWENRNIQPPIEKLIALANIYGITVDELINQNPVSKEDNLNSKYAIAPEHIRKAIMHLLQL